MKNKGKKVLKIDPLISCLCLPPPSLFLFKHEFWQTIVLGVGLTTAGGLPIATPGHLGMLEPILAVLTIILLQWDVEVQGTFGYHGFLVYLESVILDNLLSNQLWEEEDKDIRAPVNMII